VWHHPSPNLALSAQNFDQVYLKYFDLEASYLLNDYKTIKRTQESASSHRTLAFKVASSLLLASALSARR
jgi:hypothetical protein